MELLEAVGSRGRLLSDVDTDIWSLLSPKGLASGRIHISFTPPGTFENNTQNFNIMGRGETNAKVSLC